MKILLTQFRISDYTLYKHCCQSAVCGIKFKELWKQNLILTVLVYNLLRMVFKLFYHIFRGKNFNFVPEAEHPGEKNGGYRHVHVYYKAVAFAFEKGGSLPNVSIITPPGRNGTSGLRFPFPAEHSEHLHRIDAYVKDFKSFASGPRQGA